MRKNSPLFISGLNNYKPPQAYFFTTAFLEIACCHSIRIGLATNQDE